MKIPKGFIEVTGISSLRPIIVNIGCIQCVANNWRWPSDESHENHIKKLQQENAPDGSIISPPEDAIWVTNIDHVGGNIHVIESVEEISRRICEAQEGL